MSPETTPTDISFETEHCIVRELELDDNLERLCEWMSEPHIARSLNAPVTKLTIEEVRKYVASHDRIAGHALGVFNKVTGELMGIWSVYVDWEHKEYLLNVLLAVKFDSEVGGIEETGRPIHALMFDEFGMESLRYNVLASNDKMRGRFQERPEHVSTVARRGGDGSEAIQHFRITRAEYYELRSRRAQRDEEFRRKREELRQARS